MSNTIPLMATRLQRDVSSAEAKADFLFQHYVRSSHGRDVRVLVIGGRVIDHDALSSIPCAPQTVAAPEKTTRIDETKARAAEIVKTIPRSERTPEDNYADWLALDARLQAGETVSEADARWHRSYPQSAQYRAIAKRKAAA